MMLDHNLNLNLTYAKRQGENKQCINLTSMSKTDLMLTSYLKFLALNAKALRGEISPVMRRGRALTEGLDPEWPSLTSSHATKPAQVVMKHTRQASVCKCKHYWTAQSKLYKLLNLWYYLWVRKHKATLSSSTSQSFLPHYCCIHSMKQCLELKDFILRLQLMPNSNKGSSITKPKYMRLGLIIMQTKTNWFTV